MDDKMNRQKNRKIWMLFLIAVLLTLLLIALPFLVNEHFFLTSIVFLFLSFIPLMVRFEKKKIAVRELVMLAILGAVAAVSRVPFATLPSIQPATFVIIITGVVFGSESGFVVGALAAIVSNL